MEKRRTLKELMSTQRAEGIFSVILYFAVGFFGRSLLTLILGLFTPDEGLINTLSTTFRIHMLIMGVLFIVLCRKRLLEDIKRLTKKNIWFIVVMAVVDLSWGMVVGPTLVGLIISNSQAVSEPVNVEQIASMTAVSAVFGVILTGIIAPIMEELVFRKGIDQIVGNKIAGNKIIFVVISAIAFGLMHEISLFSFIYAIAGVILAITYLKTDKNIMAAIFVHCFNNLVVVLLGLLLT